MLRNKIKQIKEHLSDNSGDIYIQAIIVTFLLLLISIVIICIVASFNTKMWLDEKLDDIAKTISVTGTTKSPAITALEDEITDRLGGTFTYTPDPSYAGNDPSLGYVQLNDSVKLTYTNPDFCILEITWIQIKTDITLEKTAISNVYFKIDASGNIDPLQNGSVDP